MNQRWSGLADVWETRGNETSTSVAFANVILVAGSDPVATARVALGIANADSVQRPVTIMDCWGDLSLPFADSVAADEHGLSDFVQFGVSHTRVTRRSATNPNVSLIGSGTDDVNTLEVLSSPRVQLLADLYRAAGQLLLVACRPDSPGIESLQAAADGVILVGDVDLPDCQMIVARVRRNVPSRTPKPSPAAPLLPQPPAAGGWKWRSVQRWPVILIVALTCMGTAALLLGPDLRFEDDSSPASDEGQSAAVAGQAVSNSGEPALRIANPQDSSRAARYAIEIAVLNTRAGAELRLADLHGIEGSTYSPVRTDDGYEWYRVFAGAVASRARADSLQDALRSVELRMGDGDRVVEVPIALRMAVHPPGAEAAAEADVAHYISLGLPAYLLLQTDGSLIIYAGAFENLAQASHFSEFCGSMGVKATAAYRTGR